MWPSAGLTLCAEAFLVALGAIGGMHRCLPVIIFEAEQSDFYLLINNKTDLKRRLHSPVCVARSLRSLAARRPTEPRPFCLTNGGCDVCMLRAVPLAVGWHALPVTKF